MKTVIENVNTILTVKQELKDILNVLNQNPTDIFNEYAGQFETLLGQMKTISENILGE